MGCPCRWHRRGSLHSTETKGRHRSRQAACCADMCSRRVQQPERVAHLRRQLKGDTILMVRWASTPSVTQFWSFAVLLTAMGVQGPCCHDGLSARLIEEAGIVGRPACRIMHCCHDCTTRPCAACPSCKSAAMPLPVVSTVKSVVSKTLNERFFITLQLLICHV
jgi:hypothetical protein